MHRRTARYAAAALLLAAGAASVPAAADEIIQFYGTATISKFSSACAEYGWTQTVDARARYRPPNLGDNDKSTRFSFFFNTYAMSYKLAKGTITSSFKDVIGGATGSQTYFFENTPQLRVTSQSPETITTKTKTVTLKGQIQGWDDLPNCSATFSMEVSR